MKKTLIFRLQFLFILFAIALFSNGCNDPVEDIKPDALEHTNVKAGSGILPPGGGVLMQAFYWDVPSGGTWWNTVKGKLTAWTMPA